MTYYLDVPDPLPTAELRLPGNAGAVRVKVKRIEQRGKETWVLVEAPRWKRWSTQVMVGEKSYEGISPDLEDIWAPGFAVTSDADAIDKLRVLMRSAA
ncbi:hypothetical protein OG369_09960 [Streptomyces sp. NBC_01221]|uniref:hypothetical protein n=1 Tax=Streptomyces sp. NBC_01221 TaxID=2903782 RepID=UPI002254458B|nr:hypothetical protein [Streptomyces sp. NBC_01221]MCX4786496.1 hypothetical protein [Streptomyces sp. NBC_01221]